MRQTFSKTISVITVSNHELFRERPTLNKELFQKGMVLDNEMFRLRLFPNMMSLIQELQSIPKRDLKLLNFFGKNYKIIKNRINKHLELIKGDPDTLFSEALKHKL